MILRSTLPVRNGAAGPILEHYVFLYVNKYEYFTFGIKRVIETVPHETEMGKGILDAMIQFLTSTHGTADAYFHPFTCDEFQLWRAPEPLSVPDRQCWTQIER